MEQILIEAARKYAVSPDVVGQQTVEHLRRRYFIELSDFAPRVYWRLTDNWLELTVRFIARDHGVRDMKDRMSRDVLRALDDAGIGLASATYDIVGFPPLQIASLPEAGAARVSASKGLAEHVS